LIKSFAANFVFGLLFCLVFARILSLSDLVCASLPFEYYWSRATDSLTAFWCSPTFWSTKDCFCYTSFSSLAFARSALSYFFSSSGVIFRAVAASETPPIPPSSAGGPSSPTPIGALPFLSCSL
jgi:hypothetical protein